MAKSQHPKMVNNKAELLTASPVSRGIWQHRGIVFLAILGFSVAGYYFGRSLQKLTAPQPELTESLGVEQEDTFPEPAFSTKATIDELEKEADRVALEIVKRYPNSADSLGVLARKHFLFGDSAEANRIWQQCLVYDPLWVDAYFGMGLDAIDKGKFEKAIDMFQKVLELKPDEPRSPVFLAESFMKLDRAKEAISVLEDSYRKKTITIASLVMLGQAYFQAQEYKKAKQAYEAVLKVAPDTKDAVFGVAKTYARLGEKQKSRQYMKKFGALAVASRKGHTARAKSFVDIESSRTFLAQTHLDAGRAYWKLNDIRHAEQMWRRTAYLLPEDTESREQLVSLYEQKNRFEAALRVCKQLCYIAPKHADYWVRLGVLNAQLNHFEEAIRNVERAMKIEPDNPEYRKVYELIEKGK